MLVWSSSQWPPWRNRATPCKESSGFSSAFRCVRFAFVCMCVYRFTNGVALSLMHASFTQLLQRAVLTIRFYISTSLLLCCAVLCSGCCFSLRLSSERWFQMYRDSWQSRRQEQNFLSAKWLIKCQMRVMRMSSSALLIKRCWLLGRSMKAPRGFKMYKGKGTIWSLMILERTGLLHGHAWPA